MVVAAVALGCFAMAATKLCVSCAFYITALVPVSILISVLFLLLLLVVAALAFDGFSAVVIILYVCMSFCAVLFNSLTFTCTPVDKCMH